MKVKMFLAATTIAATVCTSCTQELDGTVEKNQSNVLSITPEVMNETASRAGFISHDAWKTNDEMGLFIYKATGWGEAYPRFDKQNNKSTKTAQGGWTQQNPVYLLQEKASIWAYYPYSTNVTDGTKIPVSISAGTGTAHDYMWGKSTNQVSVVETDAKIPMKHALSQFVIRLKVSKDYHNDGNLTSAKLKANSTKFATSGTMNLNDNGKISFTGNLRELAWAPGTQIPAQGRPNADFSAAIFPMQLAMNEVTLEVVIDGATYKYVIPTINWEAGKRYIYSITMQSNDVVIGGEDGLGITIEPWTSSENDITLTPVK